MSNDENERHMSDIQLTVKELAIAEKAADIAVKKITDNFYKDVGKTVVSRFFIIIGLVFVAFAAGKGWIRAGDIFK
jgi:hypothetical protein